MTTITHNNHQPENFSLSLFLTLDYLFSIATCVKRESELLLQEIMFSIEGKIIIKS